MSGNAFVLGFFIVFFVFIYFVIYVQIIKKVGIAFPACTYFCTYTMQSITWISICRGIVVLFFFLLNDMTWDV